MFEVSIEDCQAIFAHCSDGIVLLDSQGQQTFHNAAFSRLPEQDRRQLLAGTAAADTTRYRLRRQSLSNGEALIIQPPVTPQQEHDAVLSALLEQIHSTDDIYAATAQAIHRTLGWRWVSVTRFVEDQVEVLAHWDTDRLSDNFSFEIAGTPCEQMVRSERYTLFTDVGKAFPCNEALQQIGAQTYAGLIYQGAQQQPVGHIMAIHDQRNVDYHHAEEVITLASLALSANMLLAQANDNLARALEESRTDSLTGLYNRKHFDEVRAALAQDYDCHQHDAAMAIIDLNNFKAYNDSKGHQAGDLLLQLVAGELKKLGREGDTAFRIGGDEFALVFPGINLSQNSRLCQQFSDSMRRLSLIIGCPVESSVGCAMLSETAGCAEHWYKLADQRMYHQKQHQT
ncbi:MAG: GGDEF domain-containing protein [Marinobacterium sp.]|nr:GGDEF domain-containing protein [Marinobacterium sp.]